MIDRAFVRDVVATASHEDATAAGDRIERWLRRETDAAVTRDGAPQGGNVLARRAGDGPTLALVGHHDVVPPADSQVDADGYVVEERDGRLYGRGAADMVGALGAALGAFRAADPSCELVFASFVGEEAGGTGARFAIDDGFVPDSAVVCEGSTGYSAAGVTDVAVGHRGRRGSEVVASGTAAHASEPEAGENAIDRALAAIAVLQDLARPEAEVHGQQVHGTVTVTEIEGGTAPNVVPDRCAVTVDERTVPGERADLARVEAVSGVEVTVTQDLPPMACSDGAFADAVIDAAGAAQPGDPQPIVKPHATDAGWLAAAGTACVVCGPAEPGEAHTADESVAWEVIERCAEIYRRTAEAM